MRSRFNGKPLTGQASRFYFKTLLVSLVKYNLNELLMSKPLSSRSIISNQIKAAFVSFLGGALIAILLAFPIKWLWNWLMPGMFDLPMLSALEAWGITFLARLIFPTVVSLPNKEKSSTN